MTCRQEGPAATAELLAPLLVTGGKGAEASRWVIALVTPGRRAALELIRDIEQVASFPVRGLARLEHPHRFKQSWWAAAATVAAGRA